MKRKLLTIVFLLALSSCGEKRSEKKAREQDTTISQYDTKDEAQLGRYKQAVNAAIWGVPIVSVHAMREAYFRDAKAQYGDIVYWSNPDTWKNQTLSPNASTRTVYIHFHTYDGPMVLEIPPANGAGLFGSIADAWQVPLVDIGPAGLDKGKGGKYLLLPPGYTGHIPFGYLPVRFGTNNGFSVSRFIPKNNSEAALKSAIDMVKKIRLYPLSQSANRPEMRYIDVSDTVFNGLVKYDASFYDRLSSMINEEPQLARDTHMLAELRAIGIVKGKEFKPDSAMRWMLTNAARAARTSFMSRAEEEGPLFYLDGHWRTASIIGSSTGYSFLIDGKLDLGARAVTFFRAFAPPKKLGIASAYLLSYVDENDEPLKGEYPYVLHIPANVPVSQFWAISVYDTHTSSFIREAPVINLDSYNKKLIMNADGSVNIYFGPKPPPGKGTNWIATMPGKTWFTVVRFYGPQKALNAKTWRLGSIKKIPIGK